MAVLLSITLLLHWLQLIAAQAPLGRSLTRPALPPLFTPIPILRPKHPFALALPVVDLRPLSIAAGDSSTATDLRRPPTDLGLIATTDPGLLTSPNPIGGALAPGDIRKPINADINAALAANFDTNANLNGNLNAVIVDVDTDDDDDDKHKHRLHVLVYGADDKEEGAAEDEEDGLIGLGKCPRGHPHCRHPEASAGPDFGGPDGAAPNPDPSGPSTGGPGLGWGDKPSSPCKDPSAAPGDSPDADPDHDHDDAAPGAASASPPLPKPSPPFSCPSVPIPATHSTRPRTSATRPPAVST
ncbi:hypothetical protein K432DRAFT_402323 [Lepidopterella palustris CBS 459.81]|uniref:Uncharacterized protein n=1 Tax=Lepidopterella palustris CBS 459.81 TaxID=1314670 RepID=A0A8E2JIE1_9PEZI|nr:hypothetical protein K432DRAFT_402323 [Lepidopterella palustris CBS 459.81]